MASSKAADYLPVPQAVLALQFDRRAFCRLQGQLFNVPFDGFLSRVAKTTNSRTGGKVKAVMLFHNYANEVGTVVIDIYHVYLDLDGHRIDFKKSPWMKEFHGCPNFWAGFGMAIAPVREDCPDFGAKDPDASKFLELVASHGIVQLQHIEMPPGCTPEEAELYALADYLLEDPRTQLPPEEIPWQNDVSSPCQQCGALEHSHKENPAVPPGGSVNDLSCICPSCHARWWQYNKYYRLWKRVIDHGEWEVIRREQIFETVGIKFPEQ